MRGEQPGGQPRVRAGVGRVIRGRGSHGLALAARRLAPAGHLRLPQRVQVGLAHPLRKVAKVLAAECAHHLPAGPAPHCHRWQAPRLALSALTMPRARARAAARAPRLERIDDANPGDALGVVRAQQQGQADERLLVQAQLARHVLRAELLHVLLLSEQVPARALGYGTLGFWYKKTPNARMGASGYGRAPRARAAGRRRAAHLNTWRPPNRKTSLSSVTTPSTSPAASSHAHCASASSGATRNGSPNMASSARHSPYISLLGWSASTIARRCCASSACARPRRRSLTFG